MINLVSFTSFSLLFISPLHLSADETSEAQYSGPSLEQILSQPKDSEKTDEEKTPILEQDLSEPRPEKQTELANIIDGNFEIAAKQKQASQPEEQPAESDSDSAKKEATEATRETCAGGETPAPLEAQAPIKRTIEQVTDSQGITFQYENPKKPTASSPSTWKKDFKTRFSSNDPVWEKLTETSSLFNETTSLSLRQVGNVGRKLNAFIPKEQGEDGLNGEEQAKLRRNTLNMAVNLVSQEELGDIHKQAHSSELYALNGDKASPGEESDNRPEGYLGYSTIYTTESDEEGKDEPPQENDEGPQAQTCSPKNEHHFVPDSECTHKGSYVRAATLYDKNMNPKKVVLKIHRESGEDQTIEAKTLHPGIENPKKRKEATQKLPQTVRMPAFIAKKKGYIDEGEANGDVVEVETDKTYKQTEAQLRLSDAKSGDSSLLGQLKGEYGLKEAYQNPFTKELKTVKKEEKTEEGPPNQI